MSGTHGLVDVHQIGMGATGNETWARNVLRVLEKDDGVPLDFAASRNLPGVDGSRQHTVSGSSTRRLALDLPRVVRATRPAALVVQYTLPLVRCPGVVAIHDLSFEDPRAAAWIPRASLLRYRVTIRASARRAAVVLALTEHGRADLITRYGLDPDRVLVVPGALDDDLQTALRATPRAPRSGHQTVLCVGTVLPRKNLGVVVRAVDLLRQRGDDVRLRLVGPVRAGGSAVLDRARVVLGDALEVVGTVDLAAVASEYAAADVVAFPSYYEGLGLPVLEAMAAGTPVVSSDASCLREVGGDAVLFADPDDVVAWVEQLSAVLGSPRTADDLVGRGHARVKDFSWERSGVGIRRALDLAAAGPLAPPR